MPFGLISLPQLSFFLPTVSFFDGKNSMFIVELLESEENNKRD